jgi:hypothetical protein
MAILNNQMVITKSPQVSLQNLPGGSICWPDPRSSLWRHRGGDARHDGLQAIAVTSPSGRPSRMLRDDPMSHIFIGFPLISYERIYVYCIYVTYMYAYVCICIYIYYIHIYICVYIYIYMFNSFPICPILISYDHRPNIVTKLYSYWVQIKVVGRERLGAFGVSAMVS